MLLLVGCIKRMTPLEEASQKLTAGMTRNEVAAVFSGFSFAGRGDREVFAPTKVYQSGVKSGETITFKPRDGVFSPAEDCNVFFDTNGIIIAYRYSKGF